MSPHIGTSKEFQKLSIQVSLSGLSFCRYDSVKNAILDFEKSDFGKELTPFEVHKELKGLLHRKEAISGEFQEIVLIHRNNLFSMVPQALFDENELANYLKFNTKILANDHIAYDLIDSYEMVNVYIPFVNINNYIYDIFGEFSFFHHGTILVQSLLNKHSQGKEPTCFVYVADHRMDLVVISQKTLMLYNNFSFVTDEDFLYYILFTLEQLRLDPENIQLKLFGDIDEDSGLYSLCHEYIRHLSIFVPDPSLYPLDDPRRDSVDFTVINAL